MSGNGDAVAVAFPEVIAAHAEMAVEMADHRLDWHHGASRCSLELFANLFVEI